jgi:hypothetical protein
MRIEVYVFPERLASLIELMGPNGTLDQSRCEGAVNHEEPSLTPNP